MGDHVGCGSDTHPQERDRQGVARGEHSKKQRHTEAYLEGPYVLDEVAVVRLKKSNQLVEHGGRHHRPDPESGEDQAGYCANRSREAIAPRL